jgi:DNA polymerase sigma
MDIKITKRNVKPTASQMLAYNAAVEKRIVHRARVPNLNFGKVAFATDADVDG